MLESEFPFYLFFLAIFQSFLYFPTSLSHKFSFSSLTPLFFLLFHVYEISRCLSSFVFPFSSYSSMPLSRLPFIRLFSFLFALPVISSHLFISSLSYVSSFSPFQRWFPSSPALSFPFFPFSFISSVPLFLSIPTYIQLVFISPFLLCPFILLFISSYTYLLPNFPVLFIFPLLPSFLLSCHEIPPMIIFLSLPIYI